MKILINLCPQDILKKEKAKMYGLAGILAAVVVVSVLLSFYLLRLNQLRRIQNELKNTEKELEGLSSTVAKVEELEKRKQELNSKLGIIKDLLKESLVYPQYFEDFASRIPAKIWMDSFNPAREGDYFRLGIAATSLDIFSIAEFITILEKSGVYDQVVFGGLTVNRAGGKEGKRYTFSMSCRYRIQK